MNEIVQPSKDRLGLLYRLSQTFNSSLDLDEVLNRVMDEVIAVMSAERGFVMLGEEDGSMTFRAARGIDKQTIETPQFQVSQSVVDSVAENGEPILTADAQIDPRFSGRQSVMLQGLRSILCVPLIVRGSLTGVIYVDNRMLVGNFTLGDLDLLAAIASNAAIAIENARLYQVAVEKGRMEREMQVARGVQTSLLPRKMPTVPGWKFAARWQPAREVAGDYYDFVPLPNGELGLLIADVTDKGMPAALFMASTRSTVRASVNRASSPVEGITHANRLICDEATGGMFVSLFYMQIQGNSGLVRYVNAGHNPPLYYGEQGTELQRLTRTGMVLGVEEDHSYKQKELTLNVGDFILLYTDGVTDARNSQGDEFGMERLEALIHQHYQKTCEEIVAALEEALHGFTGANAPVDDITILLACRV